MKAPARCYGNGRTGHVHAKGCHRARPLCRAMRATHPRRSVCNCPAYWFPHRVGSGRCGNHEAMDRFVHGPIPADARVA